MNTNIRGCSYYIHSINENIWFLRRINYFPFISRNKCLRYHNESFRTPSLSCSWYKPQQRNVTPQIRPFTTHANLEPEVGWAGQPTVKRIHPILPEAYGDVCDIFSIMEAETLNGKTNETLLSNEIKSVEMNSIRGKNNAQQDIIKPVEELNHTANKEQSHEARVPMENLSTKEVVEKSLVPVNKQSLKKHKNPIYSENIFFKSGIIIKSDKKKVKKKKKTKVLESKPTLNVNKLKKRKKKIAKDFGLRKKSQKNSNLIFNQRINTQSFPQNCLLIDNGQLKPRTALSYSKMAVKVNVKETKIGITARKKKLGRKKNHTKKAIYADDCVCPESLIDKGMRKSTHICGEASGDANKKINKWKPKMCLVERKIKHRRKTFVCPNKFKKDKGKRQLPKCPKPEKKQAPRSVICPPKIDEIIEGKAKCEKQVEEIKIRKRTKVCKPVIIYGKEVAEIKIEKSLCTETKTRKKISRHTKVCPPNNKKKQKNIKQ